MKIRSFWIATLTVIVFVGVMTTLAYRHFAAAKTAEIPKIVQQKQAPVVTSSSVPEMDGLEFERKFVKGAPFSARLVIETVQTLPDGNSNTTRSVSLIYRDAEGRTRRDRMPPHFDEAAIESTTPQLTTISDPVTGFFYILEPRTNIARKGIFSSQHDRDSIESGAVIRQSASSDRAEGSSQVLPVPVTSEAGQKLDRAATSTSAGPKRELLGQREIEGVSAEGTRTTMSIPAGRIGNERSLETVVERWYSSDLKTVLLIERSDPRFGSSVLSLTSIQRSQPAAILFKVPGEFKIIPQ